MVYHVKTPSYLPSVGPLVPRNSTLLCEAPEIQRLRINADGSRSITWVWPGVLRHYP